VRAHRCKRRRRTCGRTSFRRSWCLEEIRADIGRPIPVTSGYRDAIYNAAVSGSKASLHIWFNACDISRTVAAAVVERARAHTLAPYMGIGTYANGSAHIDTRGLFGRESPARW
jgi:uncharacterized protein YcbK (DUF882 family)